MLFSSERKIPIILLFSSEKTTTQKMLTDEYVKTSQGNPQSVFSLNNSQILDVGRKSLVTDRRCWTVNVSHVVLTFPCLQKDEILLLFQAFSQMHSLRWSWKFKIESSSESVHWLMETSCFSLLHVLSSLSGLSCHQNGGFPSRALFNLLLPTPWQDSAL